MEVFVAETGFCWGIELAYARIDKLAAHGPVKATHRAGGGPGWDPIARIRAGDAELIKRHPHLANVEVVEDLATVGNDEVAAIGHQGVERALIEAAKSRARSCAISSARSLRDTTAWPKRWSRKATI